MCRVQRKSEVRENDEHFKNDRSTAKPLHDSATPPYNSYSRVGVILLAIVLVAACRCFSNNALDDPDSVYVPGAGFSGFWFTLGRLQSVPNPREKNYYCYSAGCLGVVSTLRNSTVYDMMNLALEAQRRWKEGEISRYEVVTEFVDGLLPADEGALEHELLEKLNVITTSNGVGVNIRQPKSISELREFLIQTTWIPFATGWGVSRADKSGTWHMDGGFSALLHPNCHHQLHLPFMPDLFWNTLNPNLSIDKVIKFWDAGLAYGIS